MMLGRMQKRLEELEQRMIELEEEVVILREAAATCPVCGGNCDADEPKDPQDVHGDN